MGRCLATNYVTLAVGHNHNNFYEKNLNLKLFHHLPAQLYK